MGESAGDDLTRTLVPLVAVSTLGAGALEVGVLQALSLAAFLVLGIPVGVWVDRWRRRRRVLVTADVVRAVAVLTIPAAHLLGTLTFAHLVAVVAVLGVSDVFFTTAHSTVLPSVVPGTQLAQAFAHLKTVETSSRLVTPLLGAALLRVVAAPVAALASAVGYLASACVLVRADLPPSPAPTGVRTPFWSSAREGFTFAVRQPALRAMFLSGMVLNAAVMLGNAVQVVFALEVLGLSVSTVAALGVAAGVGGLLSSLAAARIVRLVGIGRTKVAAGLLAAPCVALTPLADVLPGSPVLWLALSGAGWSALLVVSGVAGAGVVPLLTPPPMLGRVVASSRLFVLGIMPVASLTGGLLASHVGTRPVLWVWALLAAASSLPIVFSPVRTWQDVPDPPRPATG